MTNVVSSDPEVKDARVTRQANALAERLEQGARALASFASGLTEEQWKKAPLTTDRRTVGVIVHHVASVYPVEIQVAQIVAKGEAVTGLTWAVIADMNAGHFKENAAVTKQAALDLLQRNSAAAAAAIRALSDEELARAVPVSLYGDAPLTCQFVLEDHAVRHSYHHLEKLKKALL